MATKKHVNGEKPEATLTKDRVNEDVTHTDTTSETKPVVVNDMIPHDESDSTNVGAVDMAKVDGDFNYGEVSQNLRFHPEPSPEWVRKQEAKQELEDMSPKEVKALKGQHPSLEGDDDLEVARRCPDQNDKRSDKYRKVFVVQGKSFADEEWFHKRQYNALRQEAINSGVRLTGDAYFVGAEPHGDGVSLNLIYECPAVPAVTARGFAAHAPANQDVAHEMEEQIEEANRTGENPREKP